VLYFRHASSLGHDPQALSPGHPDTPQRIEAIETALAARGWAGCALRVAPAAGEADLTRVHDAAHVARIQALAEAGGGLIDDETYVAAESYQAARHAAGGACAMVRALLAGEDTTAFCGMRPSGHHAERDRAMGFCLFNNVAIAAALAVAELGVRRVVIVDWDVHHGNGTAEIFRHRSDVLVASIHQQGLFPGTGAVTDAGSGAGLGYTINAPVPAGSDEEIWVSVLEHIIVAAALEYRPQLVLISAGFDAHVDDPLGGCALEAASFAHMAAHVRDLADRLQAPVGAVLEGGYALHALADSVTATVTALSGSQPAESIAPDPWVTPRLAAHVGHHWTL
jgi:acetoin utilization deacetylase AcuC-like enzyme